MVIRGNFTNCIFTHFCYTVPAHLLTCRLNRLGSSCRSRIQSGMKDPASSTPLDSGFRRNDDIEVFTTGGNKLFASNAGLYGHCESLFCGTKQSLFPGHRRDCFVADAPRNDNLNVIYFVLSLVIGRAKMRRMETVNSWL
jgi:hypothetical protein